MGPSTSLGLMQSVAPSAMAASNFFGFKSTAKVDRRRSTLVQSLKTGTNNMVGPKITHHKSWWLLPSELLESLPIPVCVSQENRKFRRAVCLYRPSVRCHGSFNLQPHPIRTLPHSSQARPCMCSRQHQAPWPLHNQISTLYPTVLRAQSWRRKYQQLLCTLPWYYSP